MTRAGILAWLRSARFAVQASSTAEGGVQAAIVGIAVTDELEIVFDTLGSARKAVNLRADPRVALVIGGCTPGEERTVQVEGLADEPGGAELERLQRAYFEVFPDGRERMAWPGITYFRVRPTWLRASDYGGPKPVIVELNERALREATRG